MSKTIWTERSTASAAPNDVAGTASSASPTEPAAGASSKTPISYRVLSPLRLATLCSNTLTELTRLKIFHFLLLFGLLLIGGSVFLARFSFQQEFQILKDISLGAMSIFSSVLAIVVTARLIPQDIEERTVYSILAKPVSRFEYLIGRFSGVLVLLAITIAAMTVLFVAVMYSREQTVLHETARQMAAAPPDQLNQALKTVHASALNLNLAPAIGIIFIKACLLAALTLFVSTLATSNIFTIVVMVFVYFIGHLEGTAREFWLHQHGGGWLTRLLLAVVALLFPDLQAFNLIDEAVAGTVISSALFFKTVAMGVFYIVLYTATATVVFSGKEL
jgi:ABC-2 type transport system permease protein